MITLTPPEKAVIIKDRKVLLDVFRKHYEDLKERVINMEPGLERDAAILMALNWRTWMSDISELQLSEAKKESSLI